MEQSDKYAVNFTVCSKNTDFVLLITSQSKHDEILLVWLVDLKIEKGIILSDSKANTIITNETGPMKLQMK